MENHNTLDRRKMLAGSIVAGGAAFATSRFAFAQDSTPEASPAAEDGEVTTTVDTERGQLAIDRLNAHLASVQTDLESVRDQIDTAVIDELLTQITDLATKATAGVDSGTTTDVIRYGLAAGVGIESAAVLIRAQLSYPGLPSEETRSSRVLANAFDVITESGTSSTDSGSTIDVTTYTTTAQTLYASAYDLYSSGAWSQASMTGRAASGVAFVGVILIGGAREFGGRFDGMMFQRGGPDMGGRGSMPGGSRHPLDEPESDDEAPIEVPEPIFN